MKKEAILIFGGGINQLTLIEAAKKLGLTAVVIDPSEDAVGKALADVFYRVDGNDYETTKAIALRHQVKGIVTAQMENPLRLMARLAEELGYIFHSREVAERSLDKWLMKSAFVAHQVPCAQGILWAEGEALPTVEIQQLGFPLILKPRDASSSKGVVRIERLADLERYAPQARQYSKERKVILEEFMEGPEYSVESITFQGVTAVIQITEKFVTPFPYTVETGHLQPAPVSQKLWAAIERIVTRAIKALGIDNSASCAEVKLTPQGEKMVEIGARLGGDYVSSHLVRTSCGVDMDRAAIQVALGRKPELAKRAPQCACIRYLELPPGKTVSHIGNWKALLERPEVVFAHLNIKAGDRIPALTESRDRPGFVIVKAPARDEALRRAEACLDLMASCVACEAPEEAALFES